MDTFGVLPTYGVAGTFGVRPQYGVGPNGVSVSALTSTLTSSASSFTAGGLGVTLTFTARRADNTVVEGFVPQPERGVV
jgi:hypothetical protein